MTKRLQFSYNLKLYRKKAKYTRSALARIINYSEKSVEKWETGKSLPPLPVICELSEILGISLETLIYGEYNEIIYFLGINADGNSTDFLLVDAEGNEVAECRRGTANPLYIGMDACAAVLKSGIDHVCAGIDRHKITAFLGISGTNPENLTKITQIISEFRFGYFENGTDVDNAIEVALCGEDGIAVILGSGCIAVTRYNGVKSRVGGWGHLIDSGGSSYSIARDALEEVFRSIDGRSEGTLLLETFTKKLGHPPEKVVPLLYELGKPNIASYASAVFEAAASGDCTALSVLRKNAHFVAELINTSVAKYPDHAPRVVICGELSEEREALTPLISETLDDGISLEFEQRKLVFGATQLAKKRWLSRNGT